MSKRIFIFFLIFLFSISSTLITTNISIETVGMYNKLVEDSKVSRRRKVQIDSVIEYYKNNDPKYNPEFHNEEKLIFIRDNMEKYGLIDFLSFEYYIALIDVESNFIEHAVSHVGAYGYTQLMPKTAKMYTSKTEYQHLSKKRGNDNIIISMLFLKDLYRVYKGDTESVLRHYNGGGNFMKKPATKKYYNNIKRKGDILINAYNRTITE